MLVRKGDKETLPVSNLQKYKTLRERLSLLIKKWHIKKETAPELFMAVPTTFEQ